MTRAQLRVMGYRALRHGKALSCPNLLFVYTHDKPRLGGRDLYSYEEGTWLAVNRDPCPRCKIAHLRSCHNRGRPFDEHRRLVIVKEKQCQAQAGL